MNNERIEGIADKATGSVKSAVGNLTGDAKLQAEGNADKATGTVRNALGGAADAVRDAAGSVSDKAAELGQKANRLIEEDAGPLVEQVKQKASEYGRDAREAVVSGAETASGVVREYPVLIVGLVAAVAFVLGRVTAPEPRVWYRR